MLLRGMVIYFIFSMFRKPAATPPTSVDGTAQLAKGAAVNLFVNGTEFDLYVYLSEDDEFGSFNDSNQLIWVKKGLVYGDWDSGPNGDGTYSFTTEVDTTAVSFKQTCQCTCGTN
jgi:hypothetical protein